MSRWIFLVTRVQLFDLLIRGRTECYVKKSPTNNPYAPGDIYDWHFELEQGEYLFTDSYRGFNPYSGVEYIYAKGQRDPVWACDYVGYILVDSIVSEQEIYGFLKKGRGKHLLDCSGDLSRDYTFRDGDFGYQTGFSGGPYSLLQIEEVYLHDTLVGRQIAAGYLNRKERANDI